MNPAMLLAMIRSGVYHGAEGIGRATTSAAAMMRGLGGKAVGLGRRAGAAIGSGVKATQGIPRALQSAVYRSAEAIGDPLQSVAALRQRLSPPRNNYAPQVAPGLFGKLKNRIGSGIQSLNAGLQSRGFTGLSPGAYFKNLGLAGKGAAGFAAGTLGKGAVGLAGLSAKGLMGGISSSGSAIQSGGAAAAAKLSKMFAILSASGGGLSQTIVLLTQLGKAGLLAAIPLAIKVFISKILDSNRALGKWNGSIAASFNKLDIARMRSDIATARGTSGSATELNRQMIELTREFQPIREQLGIGINLAGIWLVKIGREAIAMRQLMVESFPWLKAIADRIAKEEEDLKKKQEQDGLGNQILDALGRHGHRDAGQFAVPGGIPPRGFVRDNDDAPHWKERLRHHRGK